MYKVIIEPAGITRHAEEGTLLIDLLSDAGIPLHTPCGGRGSCKKCIVTAAPLGSASDRGQIEKLVLACMTPVTEDLLVHTEKADVGFAIPDLDNLPPGENLVLALDLGTTTMQPALVHQPTGKTWSLPSIMNPQRRYGHDVIARIAALDDPDKAPHLTGALLRTIAQMHREIINFRPELKGLITQLVVSGNTTMSYLFLGLDARPLGTFPYEAPVLTFTDDMTQKARKILTGIEKIRVLPAASAFLGGDITGGLALMEREGIPEGTLFFDMGTNGEMFLKNGEGSLVATSCAMGPALEGMNISSGMTAAPGAVNHLSVKKETLDISIMGDEPPAGIAGTGLIDFLSLLLNRGLIDRSGSIKKSISKTGVAGLSLKDLSFIITEGITVTQKDIRNIQLARAASFAGAAILLKEGHITPGEIQKVIIAGSFGENLNLEAFKNLKFLPAFENAEYSFVGNTSLRAAAAAVEDSFFKEVSAQSRSIRVVDLASHQDFNDLYMESMNF